MKDKLEKKIAAFINAEHLFSPGEKVLVAVSGGADSVALTFALGNLKAAGKLNIDIVIGHVNHNLRGAAADEDEQFVLDIAAKLHLPAHSRSVETKPYAAANILSIETAARVLRMQALTEIANNCNCTAIVTAHHKDDNAETIVHRMIRGTGYRGLGGIWPKRKFDSGLNFIRPTLCVTRKEIIDYCKSNNLSWRHDHTNDEFIYTRNRIRHQLLPYLQAGSSADLADELFKLSTNCRKLNRHVTALAENAWQQITVSIEPTRIILEKKAFAAQPQPIKAELTLKALTTLGSGQRDLTQLHYQRVAELANKHGSKTLELPNGFSASICQDQITFTAPTADKPAKSKPDDQPQVLSVPGKTEFAGSTITATVLDAAQCDLQTFKANKDSSTEWFDLDKITGDITLGHRKTGDKFIPIGAKTSKKIGKFLTAAKIAPQMRNNIFIVSDTERIIWLAPARASAQTSITEATKKILQIKIT